MKVTALAGGVGGAKLLVGLAEVVGSDLHAIVNTGDDAEIYGVHVSPDIDIVTYWLAGIADTDRGWGIRDDTFNLVEGLRSLGSEAWFNLGDRDFATCLYRTQRLLSGLPLSRATAEITRSLGVQQRIMPMSDDRVATLVRTADGRTLEFQEYFVKERAEPEVAEIVYDGIDSAEPAPGVLDAIAEADRVVLCPSNPYLSLGPILALAGVRDALRSHPSVIAVSPIVRGAALKGPADRLLRSLAGGSDAFEVARLYADLCNVFVLDGTEDDRQTRVVSSLGMTALPLDTVMTDKGRSIALARGVVAA